MRPVVARLQQLFPAVLFVASPEPTSDLLDGGVLDSLALVELLAAIEIDFGIEIPLDDLDLDHFRTLDSIADLVARYSPLEATDAA